MRSPTSSSGGDPSAGGAGSGSADAARAALRVPSSAPPSLVSSLSLGDLDPEVTLAQEPVSVHGGGESLVLDNARVFFSVRPGPAIRFEGQGPSTSNQMLNAKMRPWAPTHIELGGGSLAGTLYMETAQLSDGDRPGTLRGYGEIRRLSDGQYHALTSVSFHLLNFAEYVGSWIDQAGGLCRGRLELEADGSRVTLEQRRDLRDMKDALRQEGGFAFTHIGRLERQDGGSFSSVDAEDVLTSLQWFLSFVRGLWVCPVIFTGEDAAGAARWRLWDAGRMSRWSGPPTWCDPMHWETAQEAFRGFVAEWRDPFGQAVMNTAMGQYVSANSPNPVEVAIMVAQSGLELMGRAEFVETGAVIKGRLDQSG
jgi:hypothetical protein